jgi:hypothetical protein
MSIFGLFHPETLMTGAARSAELQAAVGVCDSPGQSVISLSFQIQDCSSLSRELSSCRSAPGHVRAREEADRRWGRSAGDRHGSGQVGAVRGGLDGWWWQSL